ncbi:uncharacterized protein LOC128952112 [Oppia nitens]|uniref:uncharacterized protein LOC128952112 n=1 Tax=Oppia nitens TaxID=1686743 RepID=UPI0023DB6543|nr:uncharacterized protein LOC128952112 [Oppia nitens]
MFILLVWFKLFLVLFSVDVTYGARSAAGPQCTEVHRLKANRCAEQLFFVGRNSRQIPETEVQLQKHCTETGPLMRCVTDFSNRCRQGLHRTMSTVMVATVKFNNKNYCMMTEKSQELMAMATCSNVIKSETNQCLDVFLLALGRANHAHRRHRIPHGCCAYYQMKTCVLNEAAKHNIPGGRCTGHRVEYVERYMNSMAGNTLNLMCGDYDEDSDRCQKLSPLPTDADIEPAESIFAGFGKLIGH